MTREKNPIARFSSSGFTLVEIAVAVLICSVLLLAAVGLASTSTNQVNIAQNQQRLNAIQHSIINYKAKYNRLPCPASYIAQPGDAAPKPFFGREITYPATAGCGSYTPDSKNTFAAIGRNGSTDPYGGPKVTGKIIIGAVPVRDLGLPDSYIADTYGYMYTYAITRSEGVAPLNGFAGAINVADKTGATVLPLASDGTKGTAGYVVVDHGIDGKGAYYNGATTIASACSSTPGLDNANCNDYASGYFRSAPFSTQSGGAHFDDMIVYSGENLPNNKVCKIIYNAPASATSAGTSTGRSQSGLDYGYGIYYGAVVFYAGNFTDGFFYSDKPSGGMNATSPIVIASCTGNSHIVTGGCTQTGGAPVLNASGTHFTNVYTADYVYTPSSVFPPFNYDQQLVQPPLSHPVYTNTGTQGWECDGISAKGIYTQAYAVCCTGGG